MRATGPSMESASPQEGSMGARDPELGGGVAEARGHTSFNRRATEKTERLSTSGASNRDKPRMNEDQECLQISPLDVGV